MDAIILTAVIVGGRALWIAADRARHKSAQEQPIRGRTPMRMVKSN